MQHLFRYSKNNNNNNNNNNNSNNNTVSTTHIHKKNVLLIPIPTEVAFCAKTLYPNLQGSIFHQSIEKKLFKCSEDPTRCGIVQIHRTTAFSSLIHTSYDSLLFFPLVHYANRLPRMSQLLQSDIAPSGLCLIPSWIYKKCPIFFALHTS